jgi:hypothetical protein
MTVGAVDDSAPYRLEMVDPETQEMLAEHRSIYDLMAREEQSYGSRIGKLLAFFRK